MPTASMLKIQIQNQDIASWLVHFLSLVLIKRVKLFKLMYYVLNISVVAPERTEVSIGEEGEELVQENEYHEDEGILS